MSPSTKRPVSTLMVIVAFATVYIVWGSTYFFIKMSETGFPPFLLGAIRFLVAGMLMLAWCIFKGEKILVKKNLVVSAISGILLLVGGNGAVIWAEQTLPSGMVAIMVSSPPIWFVLLDKPNWATNFRSKATLVGLTIGFAGVILLFSEQINGLFSSGSGASKIPGMLLLLCGTLCWASGSLYSKYNSNQGSAAVNIAWQMIAAGLIFLPAAALHNEFSVVEWGAIPAKAWYAMLYLILFGSIAAFSAYVWLLQVKPATQVSTYAYVNPVIAVILGVTFAHEHISAIQIGGLVTILGSVLLINIAKHRKEKQLKQAREVETETNGLVVDCR